MSPDEYLDRISEARHAFDNAMDMARAKFDGSLIVTPWADEAAAVDAFTAYMIAEMTAFREFNAARLALKNGVRK